MKIMVLTDGETFSGLDGCAIYDVPDGLETEDIESLLEDERDPNLRHVLTLREEDENSS